MCRMGRWTPFISQIQVQIQIQQLFLLRPYSLTDGALQKSANTCQLTAFRMKRLLSDITRPTDSLTYRQSCRAW